MQDMQVTWQGYNVRIQAAATVGALQLQLDIFQGQQHYIMSIIKGPFSYQIRNWSGFRFRTPVYNTSNYSLHFSYNVCWSSSWFRCEPTPTLTLTKEIYNEHIISLEHHWSNWFNWFMKWLISSMVHLATLRKRHRSNIFLLARSSLAPRAPWTRWSGWSITGEVEIPTMSYVLQFRSSTIFDWPLLRSFT